MGPQADEGPGEVEHHKPGGRDPVGKTEATHPTAGAQEYLLPVAGRALQGKQDSSTASTRIPWNRLTPPEEAAVLAAARESPEWSSRQLATWITDYQDLSVGESAVYRLLKREGLVKPPDMKLLAGKEYQRKTSGPHQMWATDASYFRVVGWGYYYMVTVMDDYSRSILAWNLQLDMTSDSLI